MPPSSSDASVTASLQQSYAAARQSADATADVTVLHIGAAHCGIAQGAGQEPDLVKLLPLGSERLAREQFKTSPPTPLALENAIQVVEDWVMPLRPLIPGAALLFSTDVGVREIALLSGVAPAQSMHLSLDAMERTFNRLTAVVQGSPATHQGLPQSNHFAATLLILREFMHHLQFSHIAVLHAQ